ncbi:flagellar hook-associated protein FlgK [Rhodopila globiformis]|uniref:Flagellar hook-associated protein 1 n=1 Tax=Rhodopila globiformis TaxID=1071 RepID=A0A2S6MV17_RHOGL|nr:flagellar hook-associated protein FlgK [Rhodopila globiformis]PPQ26204.1 flagellar hook-associated protein FlgK [Rhodopila globiformis]
MSLDSALSIATSGLANIHAGFAVISQNVANANTPGYAAEVSNQEALTANGQGLGVWTGPATVRVDQALQSSALEQNATVTGLTTTQTALQAIDSVLGTPGSGTDIGSLLGKLQDSFSTLLTDPSSQTQQNAVVSAATTLAQGINSLSTAYTTQRQGAEDDLVSAVGTLNSTLGTIGQLNTQIVTLKQEGQSTADLENQRNAAVQTLSGLINVKTAAQPDGSLSVFTPSGLVLPTDRGQNGSGPFSIRAETAAPASYYPKILSGIMLNTIDVTSQLQGGQIGADITLRDTTLPTAQAELDEFAYGLSTRFDAQGLTLFTDGSGKLPTGSGSPTQSGYVGYAATIQVNSSVTKTASLVRDGTSVDSTGASTLNPNDLAGFTGVISNVLDYTFGSDEASGATWSSLNQYKFNTSGLGPGGTLSAPFSAPATLADYATDLVASQSQASATTTSDLTTQQALQTSLNTKISSVSGVNMDTEMSQMIALQNAYGVNARIIAAVQSMFNQLLQAVQ